MKSIQNKILLGVISGLLVFTVVISSIVVNMTHTIMQKDADRLLNNVCKKEAAYINDILGDVEKSAKVMEYYATTGISELEDLRDKEHRTAYIESAKKMFKEVAENTSGIEGYFLRINPEYSDGTTGFVYLRYRHNIFKESTLMDLTKYSEEDMSNAGRYYTAVHAGEGVWLEPYHYENNDKHLISYVLPMYVEKELLGVVGFDVDFGYLLDRVNSIDVYDQGEAVLVSPDQETSYNTKLHEGKQNPHTQAAILLKNGMYLKLRADYKDIQKDMRPMLSMMVVAFVVVQGASILYTIFITDRMVRPLKYLTSMADRILSGLNEEEVKKMPVQSKDEIGTLARALVSANEKIHEYTRHIYTLAFKDSLTGIKNTAAYAETVRKMNQEVKNGHSRFGILVADVNDLKKTNDQFGHDAGNELLIHAANILANIFLKDSIFRVGGDEFVIILEGEDYEHHEALVEKLDAACKKEVIKVDKKIIPVTIARGVALFDPSTDSTCEDVFTRADRTMYVHKELCKKKNR